MSTKVSAEVERLHNNVKQLLQTGKSEAEIIELLKKEGLEEYYAQTIVDNVLEDKRDKKGFWKLIILGSLLPLISAYLYFSPNFDGYGGWLYWALVWLPIIGSASFITRAFVFFKKGY
ncbi:MAG: hypothetical protein KA319_06165 [Ferruginibacter sp.]|nr:hypothetical protein [Ferruginibacter sp.]